MQDGRETFTRMYIVESDTEEQAQMLVEDKWEGKNDYNGGTTYSVVIDWITEKLSWEEL